MPENPFFPKKNSAKLNAFSKNFNFSGGTYKSREISDEFYCLVEKFIKKLKMAQIQDYWKWVEKFGENRLEFGEKCKIINI